MGSETKMWDVGCDRMVFAINSDLFLIHFDSKSNKWSLDQGVTLIKGATFIECLTARR